MDGQVRRTYQKPSNWMLMASGVNLTQLEDVWPKFSRSAYLTKWLVDIIPLMLHAPGSLDIVAHVSLAMSLFKDRSISMNRKSLQSKFLIERLEG